ncbi:MAG: PEGA domain-containing protein [Sandaracinaceae bacterium]
MRIDRWRVPIGVVALLLVACPAAAQQAPEPDPAAQAQRLFHEGVQLLEEGRFESARAVLERALEYEERASTGFNLASALHALERHWDAHQLLARIDRGELGPLPDGYAEPAAQLRAALDAALGRLELTLASPEEAAVFVDGIAAGGLVQGSAILRTLPAGVHVVRAEADGFANWEREVTLDAGVLERLSVELAPSVDIAVVTSPPPSPGSDAAVWVGVTIAVVAALAVVGVVLGVVLSDPSCDPVVGCIEF